jgi:hypothetical protein
MRGAPSCKTASSWLPSSIGQRSSASRANTSADQGQPFTMSPNTKTAWGAWLCRSAATASKAGRLP